MKKKKKKKTVKCKIYKLSPSYCYKKFKCRCEICKKWKKEKDIFPNREKAKKISKLWRLNNLERSRQNSKNYQKKHPEQLLKWQLKKYNLTVKQYNILIEKQKNKCAICGQAPKGMQNSKKRLCVDHNKKTGKVRGLLCGACNIGLGHFNHSTILLKKAIKYLKRRNIN